MKKNKMREEKSRVNENFYVTFLIEVESKGDGRKRKQPSELPDGSGWGDHIQLLQVYEAWDQVDYDRKWCTDNDLQVRSMVFAKDVRNQLSQIIQKIAKGPCDVESSIRRSRSEKDYRNLRRALCRGYGNQLAERMLHHNGYRTLGYRSQLVQVHPSSVLESDEYGHLPDYVVYHELINVSRPFMRNVCAVEMAWVMSILRKIEKMDVNKLRGGSYDSKGETKSVENEAIQKQKPEETTKKPSEDVDSKIQAARERYLARKAKK